MVSMFMALEPEDDDWEDDMMAVGFGLVEKKEGGEGGEDGSTHTNKSIFGVFYWLVLPPTGPRNPPFLIKTRIFAKQKCSRDSVHKKLYAKKLGDLFPSHAATMRAITSSTQILE
jgi:hypothetical protein